MTKRRLSETDAAVAWLQQFKVDDQTTAVAMLDAMTLVSREEFSDRLSELILQRANNINRPIGLYAEREIHKRLGIPDRLFKETRGKVRRAYGPGPAPIKPARKKGPEIGSEGIVAQLITELRRQYPEKFLSHPGPDEIRGCGVGAFFLVTDFIGSGKRACMYLEAAWRIASVKSWRSLGLIRFEAFAYAGTDPGKKSVEHHRSRPAVSLVAPCPTIETEFDSIKADRVRELCIRYDPLDHDPRESVGFGGVGALLAFAHGCPNNAPRILHRARQRKWKPLFPSRVTSGVRALFGDRRDSSTLASRLARLGESRLAQTLGQLRYSEVRGNVIALLAALRRGPRRDDALARRTGLTLPEVAMLIDQMTGWGWIGSDRRLTDLGRGQLVYFRSLPNVEEGLPSEPEEPYYPKSLRAPRSV